MKYILSDLVRYFIVLFYSVNSVLQNPKFENIFDKTPNHLFQSFKDLYVQYNILHLKRTVVRCKIGLNGIGYRIGKNKKQNLEQNRVEFEDRVENRNGPILSYLPNFPYYSAFCIFYSVYYSILFNYQRKEYS